MSENMISIEDGFQYSINIAFDIHNEKKLSSFIPTKSSLKLIEDILLSTKDDSTDRARVLVGAYGKGKSHIVLSILSLLNGTQLNKFTKLQKKIKGEKIEQLILNYQESKKRLLPVLITGTGSSISQSFLLALQRTLSENNLMGLMPDTNFKAAIKTIRRWEKDYPSTYKQFKNEINEEPQDFISKLQDFDNDTYRRFEEVYPALTSGGAFNPFLGFDVTEIYESVVKSLKESNSGYSGLFIVYDEFSKYLESNIASATVNDTKMLQDFAEKCNRSADKQLHLMLICHKEISNYIDNLPKQKVDGWRGISERFTHIHLNNNFTQTYEIIESVILKDINKYSNFKKKYEEKFSSLVSIYSKDSVYNDLKKEELKKAFEGCYPLHPISMYILPRLSERVAQNERTLFTFLSSPGAGGLPSYLKNVGTENLNTKFNLITPDALYDYFEPLFKKEVYTEDLYKIYTLTTILLDKLDTNSLEAKIIKTLSLIYILAQFERLAPTGDTLIHSFSESYNPDQINDALKNLIEKECIVYLKRSNNFYSLKQSSGIDINEQIQKAKSSRSPTFSLKNVLNSCNFDRALYPLRYNDEREMTRFFEFVFIDENEVNGDTNWKKKTEQFKADGVVYAILPSNKGTLKKTISLIEESKNSNGRFIFIIPNKLNDNQKNIFEFAREYDAVKSLIENVGDDNVLRDEYEVILNDLQEIILDFIGVYTHCENGQSTYLRDGKKLSIKRKADLTKVLSDICDIYFKDTPVIINESVNKNTISTAAANARNKIISSLLRNDLEKNLGLTGGQELAIMRSLLVKPGIINSDAENPVLRLDVEDKKLNKVLSRIKDFVISAKEIDELTFLPLYTDLTTDKKHIGLRKGLIPVYLACIIHEFKKQISIFRGVNELPITAETICAINDTPDLYTIKFMDWSSKEDEYIENLANLFSVYVRESEKGTNAYDYVFNAIRRWYMDLPKYTKEMKKTIDGESISKDYSLFLKNIKTASNIQDFIFKKLKTFNSIEELGNVKKFYDKALNNAIDKYAEKVCSLFGNGNNISKVLNEWSNSLNESTFNMVFAGGTTRFINLCKNTEVSDDVNRTLARQIAYISSDLNIEDWNDSTVDNSLENIKSFKSTAEEENAKQKGNDSNLNNTKIESDTFEINYVSQDGKVKSKRFNKSKKSARANILSRSLKNNLDGMGMSVSDNEKRQVLMELLIELCGDK